VTVLDSTGFRNGFPLAQASWRRLSRMTL
jgi:hypothetical protein